MFRHEHSTTIAYTNQTTPCLHKFLHQDFVLRQHIIAGLLSVRVSGRTMLARCLWRALGRLIRIDFLVIVCGLVLGKSMSILKVGVRHFVIVSIRDFIAWNILLTLLSNLRIAESTLAYLVRNHNLASSWDDLWWFTVFKLLCYSHFAWLIVICLHWLWVQMVTNWPLSADRCNAFHESL